MKEAYRLALKHSDDRIRKMYHRTTQKTMSDYFRTTSQNDNSEYVAAWR